MSTVGRPLSALLLTLALAAGHVAECAGWLAAPEARMACCLSDDSCPMHESEAPGSASMRVVSQAEADRCCAVSEQDDSAPTPASFALSVSLAVVPGAARFVAPPAAACLDAGHRVPSAPTTRLPRHLLLSVLLV